jgi:DNA primase
VLGLDGDKAGQEATNKLKAEFRDKKLVRDIDMNKHAQGKDINDLSQYEFDSIVASTFWFDI